MGTLRLGLSARPSTLIAKQAVAAVGQSRLMRVYATIYVALTFDLSLNGIGWNT